MVDLSFEDVARVLGRTSTDVRALQYRAFKFLRARLTALGRTPRGGREPAMSRYRTQAPVLRRRRFRLVA
jgi:hypothetical protein